jgi:hypothetical protein
VSADGDDRPDRELFRRLAGGDADALAGIYDRHGAALFRHAFALALLNWIPANTETGVADGFDRTAYEVAKDAAEDAHHAGRLLGLPEADCRRLGDMTLVAASRPERGDAVAEKEWQ